jgi:hypothetical protein
MESNPFALPYKTQQEQNKWGRSFASHLGCSSLACMRSKSADDILKAELATFHISLNNLWYFVLLCVRLCCCKFFKIHFKTYREMALLWTPVIDGKLVKTSTILSFPIIKTDLLCMLVS